MRLFYSPFHSFIHKVLVTAHESGLWDEITFVPTYPFKNRSGEDQGDRYSIAELNPLNKVPTLATANGRVIYGSQAVAEYLDMQSRSGRHLFPAGGERRWDAITRMSLSDTIFETTVTLVMEGWNAPEDLRIATYQWIWPKIFRGLDRLEQDCKRGFDGFDIGQAAMLHAISYMDFRGKFYPAKDPLHPGYDPFDGRPNLTAWWADASRRPSVLSHYNKDFTGDDSAEFCQRNVREVLELQKENRSP